MSMPPNENTPLIAVVRVTPPRPRPYYRHSTIRRCFSFLLGSALILAIVSALVLVILVPECEKARRHESIVPCIPKHPFYRHHQNKNQTYSFSSQSDAIGYDDLVEILRSTPDESKIREWSKYYTSGPHLAGKNLSQAEWTRDRWIEFGVSSSEVVAYDVYINYPLDHRLALLEGSEKQKQSDASGGYQAAKWKVKYEATLVEDVLPEDETTGLDNSVPTFHGYSASGNVTAPYVFVNYGTYQDYQDLVNANVSLKGKIALVKYGDIFRGLKVKRAQELGMVGAVIYSDPGDDGEVTKENGYKTYPDGPARNPSSVQRGSVQFLSIAPGDPTTPGYPSKPGCIRGPANFSTPSIPSIPISYVDALPLLRALNGHGLKAESLGKGWSGGGLASEGVDYNIGPTPDNLVLNLFNEQEYQITPLWNVIGIINGTLSDEVVILGNHRDAWIAGGAADPNSGSAALNEVVRSFGIALSKGWKPLRTIVFASWDGEEYGLIGSTEWVEEYLPWLNATAVAYLNVDGAANGPVFRARAGPLLNKALIETTKLVLSPNQSTIGQTIYDVWDKRISTMGSGSDFTAFQDFAGIPSVDMGFGQGRNAPVYHYHSNYDSFHWMDKYGDPGFLYHAAAARVWALLTAKISESLIVPLNATDYADGLLDYLARIMDKASNSSYITLTPAEYDPLVALDGALHRLRNRTIKFDAEASTLLKDIEENPVPWWRWWEKIRLRIAVGKVNYKYKRLDRQFLFQDGLDGRPWFKHVVFAPGIWTGYAGATFPGLSESVESGNKSGLYKWSNIITGLVEKARASLKS